MNLKDARQIKIDGKRVQQILMPINDSLETVWQEGRLVLSSSSQEYNILEHIKLHGRIGDYGGNLLPVSGTFKLYENNTLITSFTKDDGLFIHWRKVIQPGVYTYKLVFVSDDRYEYESNTVSVMVVKDTPSISSLTGDVYNGWKIGCVLKDSMGNPLKNKNIVLSGAKTGTIKTNNDGKATIVFNGTQGKSYTINYRFNGDSYFNSCSVSKTFKVNKDKSIVQCVGTMSVQSTNIPFKDWSDKYTNCSDNYLRCDKIATVSGSHNRPGTLNGSVKFSLPAGSVLVSCTCWWKSKLVKDTGGSGWGNIGAPTVIVSSTGANWKSVTMGKPGRNTYVSADFKFSATVAGLNDGMNIRVNFPKNTAHETAELWLVGPKISVVYRPGQGAL